MSELARDLRRVRPPVTVIALAAVVVAVLVSLLLFGRVDAWLFGGGAVLLLATFGVVRGVWFAWFFLVVVAVGDVLVTLASRSTWWASSAVVNLALLLLLLAPDTRRHVRRSRSDRADF